MRRRSTRFRWALAAMGPTCFACNGILGIEERTLSEEQTLAPLSCATYCEEALASCSGEFAIYASSDVCMEVCASLPLGVDADPSGNTVACRLAQARLAKQSQEFSFYCPAAGPGGDGVCGENCEGYCELMLDICPGVFDDTADCLEDCEGVPSLGLYHVPTPEENTIQCRLYHLTSATLDSVHCDHASGDLKCVE